MRHTLLGRQIHRKDSMKKRSFTRIKLALLALVSVMMAMPAMAQGSPNRTPSPGCGVSYCTGVITSLYTTSAGGNAKQAQIFFSMNVSGISCTLVSNLYFPIPPNSVGYSEMYRMLLQASVTGEVVTVDASAVSSTNPLCNVTLVSVGAP